MSKIVLSNANLLSSVMESFLAVKKDLMTMNSSVVTRTRGWLFASSNIATKASKKSLRTLKYVVLWRMMLLHHATAPADGIVKLARLNTKEGCLKPILRENIL